MKRAPTIYLSVFLFAACLAAAPEWKNIALKGIEVTALQRMTWGNILILGTAGHGVYQYLNGVAKPILANDPATDSVMKKRTVHCLEIMPSFDFVKDAFVIAAGTDSGLYVYDGANHNVPLWKPVAGVPRTDIRALHYTTSPFLFIATDREVYRTNFKTVDTLHTLTDSLPSWAMLCIRCITSFKGDIYGGSILTAADPSWGGILRSKDSGDTWAPVVSPGSVHSLAVYNKIWNSSKPSFLAVTGQYGDGSTRVYAKTDEDTSWSGVDALDDKGMRTAYVTDVTKSNISVRHVAGKAGVFKDSMSALVRLGDLTEVNALLANRVNDYDSLFAGAKDGLYVYADAKTGVERHDPLHLKNGSERADVQIIPFAAADRKNPVPCPFEIFTLEGKRVHPGTRVRHTAAPFVMIWGGR